MVRPLTVASRAKCVDQKSRRFAAFDELTPNIMCSDTARAVKAELHRRLEGVGIASLSAVSASIPPCERARGERSIKQPVISMGAPADGRPSSNRRL